MNPKNKIPDEIYQILCQPIQTLFKEAEIENLTPNQFAIRIWLGTILQSLPEKTLTSILFEKASGISPAETYQLIDNLTCRSFGGDTTAIKRATTLIIDGLALINEAENEIPSR